MTANGTTGVLLVGGASERFGSPKALARLRGETLAERGWRLLGEACDEVIAVGKAGAGLPLTFEVVDDDAPGHAPAFGVLAGLRAARHDTCVVLPVDCPLVTPGALRSLAETVTVAPGGPLPGAYTRDHVGPLAERVAAGRLTLRGLNPHVSKLPAALFTDVDSPADLAEFERPGHALVVGGTGMLAGLTRSLAGRGHPVTVVSRRPAALADGAAPACVDYRDTAAFAAALDEAVAARGVFELAVCWIHTDAPAAPAVVAERVMPGGRLVQLFGTAVWPLEPVPVHLAHRIVLLGGAGERWSTHEEISGGVLAGIDADLPLHVVGEGR